MQITILTIFPTFFDTPFQTSMIKRAIDTDKVSISVVNLRDYAHDKHQTTDDRPYGGGPGMVMKVEPVDQALTELGLAKVQRQSHQANLHKIVLTSAKGNLFTQQRAVDFATLESLTIICGHYEGVDERVAEHLVDEEVRIGDYVLTGGEAAALVMTDSITRLLPGVLGNELSNQDESHTQPGTLGFPQYTRPEVYNGWKVPEILLQGNHAQINEWRQEQKKQK